MSELAAMSDETLFRIALAPSALVIWGRTVAWPLSALAMIGWIYTRNKLKAERLRQATLVRGVLIAAGALLLVSLAPAYLLIPKSDPQAFVIWYGAMVGSIPVVIPAIVVYCFRPHVGFEAPVLR